MGSKKHLYVKKALACADQLAALADRGDLACKDDRSAVFYGVVRDCAYKIKVQANKHLQQTKGRPVWYEV
jgi:hypothetical protein